MRQGLKSQHVDTPQPAFYTSQLELDNTVIPHCAYFTIHSFLSQKFLTVTISTTILFTPQPFQTLLICFTLRTTISLSTTISNSPQMFSSLHNYFTGL